MLTKDKILCLAMDTETFNNKCLELGTRVGYLSSIRNGWFYFQVSPPTIFEVLDKELKPLLHLYGQS